MNPRPPLRALIAVVLCTAMSTTLAAVAAPSTYSPPPQPSSAAVQRRLARPAVRPGELIVKAAPGRARALARVLGRGNARAAQALGGGVSLVSVAPGTERAAAAALSSDPAVAYAEPNYLRAPSSHVTSEVGWGVRSSRAPFLWLRSPSVTGSGIRVAVLDSGVDHTQAELAGRIASGYDAYGGSGRDDCGHGTAVAGVIAAAHDGSDIVGVAPGATIVPVKVLQFDKYYGCAGDDAAIIRGIRWAAGPGNADIINLSLGAPYRSRALGDAIVFAASRGVLVVAASGNSGDRTVNYPAGYPQVMSVGGMRRAAGEVRWWPQSSFGAVDIVAAAQGVPVLRARGVDETMVGRSCPGDPTRWCSDGTSFAAPHVAGVAALLYQQHAELRGLPATARLRRLRQWLLATAPRVTGTSAGMDLRAGHGRPDAVAAAKASVDRAATLLTWQAPGRVLAPTSAMRSAPWRLRLELVATRGTGTALVGRPVRFTHSPGGSVSRSSATTNAAGRAEVLYSSRSGAGLTRLTAAMDGRTLAVDSFVLDRDDNVPGVMPPARVLRRSLNLAVDFDDVFRLHLYAGETMRAEVTDVDQRRERVILYLHPGSTADVTNPFRPPMTEDGRFNGLPQRLKVTVSTDGVRYLDAFGFGTYRLRWWIYSPGRMYQVSASPSAITPNNDGRADTTRISWRQARAGLVTLLIRNDDGLVVRRVALGRLAGGAHAYRWGGRNQQGNVVRAGRYVARLEWSNGAGRVSADATVVTVRR